MPYSDYRFPLGRSGIVIAATISFEKRRAGVELYIQNRDAQKTAFHQLLEDRDAIELDLEEKPDWQELLGKKASRIVVYRRNVDPSDPSTYDDLHAWMLDRLERFKKAFSGRVTKLDLSPSDEPDDREEE